MKKITTLTILMIGSLLMFLECTNEEPIQITNNFLVKSPKAIMYYGDNLYGTRGNQDAPFWTGTKQEKPEDITLEELEVVREYFRTHHGIEDAITIDFSNFYVQQVDYADDLVYNLANGGTSTPQRVINQITAGQANGENIFSGNDPFNKCRYIFDSSTLDFWYCNTECGNWSNKFKMVYIPGYGYYVGFDGEGKSEEEAGANKNQIITNSPDGWFFDRIIKIIPADGEGNILPLPDDNFGKDDEDDKPEITLPGEHNCKDEVEVNLHGVEKNGEYLESHLSIHIRCATDVEIFIPMDMRYVCETDDMDIVMKHEPNHMEHNFEWTLKDSDFKVSILVVYEEGGIRITTHGVTQEVIDWCQEKCEDGITFEVWNYFNDPEKLEELGISGLSIEELRGYLNQATIRFLDKEPSYYVNAFTDNEGDCEVNIIAEQERDYDYVGTGVHRNGSLENKIYNKNDN